MKVDGILDMKINFGRRRSNNRVSNELKMSDLSDGE